MNFDKTPYSNSTSYVPTDSIFSIELSFDDFTPAKFSYLATCIRNLIVWMFQKIAIKIEVFRLLNFCLSVTKSWIPSVYISIKNWRFLEESLNWKSFNLIDAPNIWESELCKKVLIILIHLENQTLFFGFYIADSIHRGLSRNLKIGAGGFCLKKHYLCSLGRNFDCPLFPKKTLKILTYLGLQTQIVTSHRLVFFPQGLNWDI